MRRCRYESLRFNWNIQCKRWPMIPAAFHADPPEHTNSFLHSLFPLAIRPWRVKSTMDIRMFVCEQPTHTRRPSKPQVTGCRRITPAQMFQSCMTARPVNSKDCLALCVDWRTVNLNPLIVARSRQGGFRLPHGLAKIGRIFNQLILPERCKVLWKGLSTRETRPDDETSPTNKVPFSQNEYVEFPLEY